MGKRSKRFKKVSESIDRNQVYAIDQAVEFLKSNASAKFDETVDLAAHLGVDAKQAEQNLRGTISLPHGTGKKVRVIVFAEGENAQSALDAGADEVGVDELVDKIADGWMEFDATVSTPDLMRRITPKLGRILGPRGLMPNAKTGTVTNDVAGVINNIKAGQIEYRVERESGIVHVPVGKASFGKEQIEDNIQAVMGTLIRVRPSTVKGRYLKSVSISSTMGAGIRVDLQSFV